VPLAFIWLVFTSGTCLFRSFSTETERNTGAFLLGLIFGIVSSPCATPILVLILTFVASRGEIIYGTSLLFVYAIAHCALIFVAGVGSGALQKAFLDPEGLQK